MTERKGGVKATRSKKGPKKVDSSKNKTTLFITGSIILIFILAIAGLMVFTYKLLYKSDYFFIKVARIDWRNEPLSKAPYQALLDTGVGHNIFKFDVSSAADKTQEDHPELKSVRIKRDFPDRLTFEIEPRLPLAQVGETSFFLIDEEGVVLTETSDYIRDDLPIITGVGWRFLRKVGQKEGSARMVNALNLLEAIEEAGFSRDHTLTKIDVSDHRNISFFIEDGLEVKIGHSNFKNRIEQLHRALASMVIDRDEVRYIDLRFDDVVLGTR